jgi:hypothetical protein
MKVGQKLYSQGWNENNAWTQQNQGDDWVQDAEVENDWDNTTRV